MSNPDWARDELILALDLYLLNNRQQLDSTDPQVIALSELLNRLPIHDSTVRDGEFRNPNGVAMKLGNFSSIDPSYPGTGLRRGNKLEAVVWKDFAENPDLLRRLAQAISQQADASPAPTGPSSPIPIGDEDEFPEGRLLTRLHFARERNRKAVKRKKAHVLGKTGKLACECCDFDFAATYGAFGAGFAECHHLVPISELNRNGITRLIDLSIVCANCHRMLHRTRPLMAPSRFRSDILKNRL
ncbi:MAG: HNH endonuclease [Gemmatimonadales bacterium]|nr:HNH endonuclease [Gemmatimonadales bacterium]